MACRPIATVGSTMVLHGWPFCRFVVSCGIDPARCGLPLTSGRMRPLWRPLTEAIPAPVSGSLHHPCELKLADLEQEGAALRRRECALSSVSTL